MADIVEGVVAAPKKAIGFAENNLAAFAMIVVAALLLFVVYDSRHPGVIRTKVAKIPGVGTWLTKSA